MENLLKRILGYCLGLFVLALGVAVSVNSELGVSPVNSFPYVLSLISDIDFGRMVIIVFCFYIFLQILILRQDFKWINLSQIVFSFIFGYFVDFAKWIVGDFALPTYLGSLIMLAISMVLIAIGVSLYVAMDLVNMPMEGLVDAIQRKFLPNKTFADVKVIVDTSVVILGGALSLIFLGGLYGVREGTIISALFVGKIMGPVRRFLDSFIEKLR